MEDFIAGMMVDDFFKTIVTVIASAVAGYLLGFISKYSKRNKAVYTILKCVARNDIRDYYERYVVRGEHLSEARYNEIVDEFDAYEVVGGNGQATNQYMDEIRNVRPWMITD